MISKLNIPILFLVFSRPETTELVFDAIRKAKPSKLYIAANSPRLDKIGEAERCEAVRKIVSNVDWDCEVKTLFRDNHLICKDSISGAISWFFDNEEMGIILEDDCLPSLSFFFFCQELLEKYKDEDQVFIISGDNFNKNKIGEADYYFSRIPNIWGWATWRRAWKKYDVTMSSYDKFKEDGVIKNIWSRKIVQNYWLDIFDKVYNNKIDTWDYQLAFSIFSNQGLCICPNKNLISNIGFGGNSTNTIVKDKRVSDILLNELVFPLKNTDNLEYSEANDYCVNKINLNNYLIKKTLSHLGIFSFIKKIYVYAMSNLRK